MPNSSATLPESHVLTLGINVLCGKMLLQTMHHMLMTNTHVKTARVINGTSRHEQMSMVTHLFLQPAHMRLAGQ